MKGLCHFPDMLKAFPIGTPFLMEHLSGDIGTQPQEQELASFPVPVGRAFTIREPVRPPRLQNCYYRK